MISKNENGQYICHDCGQVWKNTERWLYFPIKVKFSKSFSFGKWGVETEPDGAEHRVFKTIIAIGWIRLVFGDGYKSKVKWSVQYQKWVTRENKNYLDKEQEIDRFLEKITQ